MKNIGEVIAFHRKNKKISQIDIATELEKYDIHIKNAAVSAWEKRNSIPSADTLLALCEILGINDIYTEFIGENPNDPFKDLNEEGVKKVLDYIELLKKTEDYQKQTAEIVEFKPRIMKVALLPASAGTGYFIDDENFDEVEIYDQVPRKATFGVYLDGDSMEPRFKDEQLVWIEQTDCLDSGDIGLFYLDGKTYFKKYIVKSAGTFLLSLNAKYKPIPISEYSSFKIFGKLAID
ncbi:Phage repressor protein C, contains Cro/C1-type HTH and peptisase s24 domains [Acetitomaculum ruminis DSM 5522]|uniref:Phage repressor protein C, contains Cro/C1-type HTH and peptisase s24 domains n=1 Tax=Acetitomaculum ruminis DSM 5522 TaxID=1120918 RepID=A0A1I0ZZ87_9FIRM|nr:XRE family transcriptional regulator [Acetitomaculum ruminis]SFB31049.1 Phage repressor protein C, contains Cro/C1-type HTH and peptisase s24 domains [Acetitomaculum ruminis DSM 5522]